MEDCIFCKVASGQIPSTKVYENNDFMAVMDIYPATKGHVVVFPKKHYRNFLETPQDVLGAYMSVVQKVTAACSAATGAQGCRIQNNLERFAGQSIFHVHFHIIPMSEDNMIQKPTATAGWTPLPDLYKKGEMQQIADKIKANIRK